MMQSMIQLKGRCHERHRQGCSSNQCNSNILHLVIRSARSEAIKSSLAFRVLHTCQNLLAALCAHLPDGGKILCLHALHQRNLQPWSMIAVALMCRVAAVLVQTVPDRTWHHHKSMGSDRHYHRCPLVCTSSLLWLLSIANAHVLCCAMLCKSLVNATCSAVASPCTARAHGRNLAPATCPVM